MLYNNNNTRMIERIVIVTILFPNVQENKILYYRYDINMLPDGNVI